MAVQGNKGVPLGGGTGGQGLGRAGQAAIGGGVAAAVSNLLGNRSDARRHEQHVALLKLAHEHNLEQAKQGHEQNVAAAKLAHEHATGRVSQLLENSHVLSSATFGDTSLTFRPSVTPPAPSAAPSDKPPAAPTAGDSTEKKLTPAQKAAATRAANKAKKEAAAAEAAKAETKGKGKRK